MVLRKPIPSEIETQDECDDLAFQTSQVDLNPLSGATPAQLAVSSPALTRSPASRYMLPEHPRMPPLEVAHDGELNLWADELMERPKPVDLWPSHQAGDAQGDLDEGKLGEEEQLSASRSSLHTPRLPPLTEIPGNNGVSNGSDRQYPPLLQSNNPFLKTKLERTSSWSDLSSNRSKTASPLSIDLAGHSDQ
jgi:hypothetical protein